MNAKPDYTQAHKAAQNYYIIKRLAKPVQSI